MPKDKKMNEHELKDLLKKKFRKINIKKDSVFDKDPGHNHWHVVLFCQSQKEL
jgi:hypothetical protein